ncbi:MAG: hypothetical protein OXC07_08265 [Kistimonas sp.]|nr:hypothetical protein [Kistimonas sp.]
MAVSFFSALGDHPQLLGLQVRRLEVYGGNLVNAGTPGYRARDFDDRWRKEGLALVRTRESHLQAASEAGRVSWRGEIQAALDGNSVDLPVEQTAVAHALSEYSVNLSFMRHHLSLLGMAVNGRAGGA